MGKLTLIHAVFALLALAAQAAIDGLPSERFDDYDEQKYQELYNSSAQDYARATQFYQAESSELSRLNSNYQSSLQDLNETRSQMNRLAREREEMNRELRENGKAQRETYQNLKARERELEELERDINLDQGKLPQMRARLDSAKKEQAKEHAQMERLNEIEKNAKIPLDSAKSNLEKNQKDQKQGQETIQVLTKQTQGTALAIEDLKKKKEAAKTPEEAAQLQAQIESKENYLKELRVSVQTEQGKLQDLKGQEVSLKAEAEKAQKSYDLANSAAEEQRKAEKEAQTQVSQIQKNIQETEGRLSQNQKQKVERSRQLNELARSYERMQARARALEQNLDQNERQQLLQSQRERDLVVALDQLSRQIEVQRIKTEDARIVMVQSQTEMRARLARLNEVISNKSQARSLMRDQVAGPEGRADGKTEGGFFGTEVGRTQGLADGKARGLKYAYDSGYTDGHTEGITKGTDQRAYKVGFDRGVPVGDKQADQTAQPERKKSYDTRENEYLNAPLKQVTLGSNAGFEGLQSRPGDISLGDGRNYNPRPKAYPHPIISQYYMEFYDNAYRTALTEFYESSKTEAYNHYENVNFESFKNDSTQFQLGQREGLRVGSDKKGYKDGIQSGYDTNLPLHIKRYQKMGRDEASSKYDNNAILKYLQADIVEVDNDSIFRPGDIVTTQFVVKNFGLKSKSNLTATLQDIARIKGFDRATVSSQVPELPGQSEITILFQTPNSIRGDLKEGDSIAGKLQIQNPDGSIEQNYTLSKKVGYPTWIRLLGYDGVFVPGEKKNLEIELRNVSTKDQDLTLHIQSEPDKLQLSVGGSLSVGGTLSLRVEANTIEKIPLVVRGVPEAEFEATLLNFLTLKKTAKYAEDLKLAPTVIRRHQYLASNQGLILSGDLSQGGAKDLYKLKFDTWDLRVDGAMGLKSALDDYVTKSTVHLMLDEKFDSSTQVFDAIQSYVQKGGALVAWVSDSHRLASLENLLGAAAQSNQVTSIVPSGGGIWTGVSPRISGPITTFALEGEKGLVALAAGQDIVAVGYHNNEFTPQLARALTLGFSPSGISGDDIQKILERLELWKLPFAKKTELAAQNPAYLSTVLMDLKEEISDDLLRTDVRWMRDAADQTLLKSAITSLLSKDNPNRKAFVQSYPVIFDFSEKIKDGDVRVGTQRILSETKVGSWWNKVSWEGAYCNDFRSERSDLCPGF